MPADPNPNPEPNPNPNPNPDPNPNPNPNPSQVLAYEDASQHAGRGAAAVTSFVSGGMGDELEDLMVDERDP